MSFNSKFSVGFSGLNKLFDHDGYIKLAPKVGDGEPPKPVDKEKQEEINYCLNCKKTSCRYGNCKDRPRKRRSSDD